MDRPSYICIHGHFYQPPRENPWLEAIAPQDSAYPYHDWNARVTAEAYAPNAASRILDERGCIVRIVNNYERISFNFGPTLLAWLERHDETVYRAILDADRASRDRFGGHGSAIAQAYGHMIMPLATARDMRTQVRWGITDFEHRFGRSPEGMWLPETAVDIDSLEALAQAGIRYTVLAPNQAARVRRIGEDAWRDVSGGRVDPRRAYLQRLPSGRTIALFFYDGAIAQGVAFEGLLRNGERLANRLAGAISREDDGPQLVHIATDGETYGHHHEHGEMALSYALRRIEDAGPAKLTNYGEYLERHPPTWEVEILENTSWSCAHGIDRWRADCGCHTGGEPGWDQRWRRPLRDALDWLRASVDPLFERHAARLLHDPWAARDDYIDVVLERSVERVDAFLERHATGPLDEAGRVRALELLELQRHAMLMYTSCGWFFNDVSGIETVQVLQYAGRAIQLAEAIGGEPLEAGFLERLEAAESNRPDKGDARRIYEATVAPSVVRLPDVTAHHAIQSVFEPQRDGSTVYAYHVEPKNRVLRRAGRARLLIGHGRVSSRITGEAAHHIYGVLHLGDHNLSGGLAGFQDAEAYDALVDAAVESFDAGDLSRVLRTLDEAFAGATFTLRSLFPDEQRRILDRVLGDTLKGADALYRRFYDNHAPLIRFLAGLDIPLPHALSMASNFVLDSDLKRAAQQEELDAEQIRGLFEEAERTGAALDAAGIEHAFEGTLVRLARAVREAPSDPEPLDRLNGAVELVRSLPLDVNLWEVQNVFYDVLRSVYPALRAAADERPGTPAGEHAHRLEALAERLDVAIAAARR